MSKVKKGDIIIALRDERRELVERVEAIDAALKGFGAPVPRKKPNTGTSRPEQREALRADVYTTLVELGDWTSTPDLASLVGVPNNGTLLDALKFHESQSTIERRANGEGPRAGYHWRVANNKETS